MKEMDKRQLRLGKRNQWVLPLTLRNVGISYPGQSSFQLDRPILTECSLCASTLEDQVIPSCISCSTVQPWQVLLVNCIFKGKVLSKGRDISEELSPAKVDTDVMSWIQKLTYTLLPANVHIAWKSCFNLWTISR